MVKAQQEREEEVSYKYPRVAKKKEIVKPCVARSTTTFDDIP